MTIYNYKKKEKNEKNEHFWLIFSVGIVLASISIGIGIGWFPLIQKTDAVSQRPEVVQYGQVGKLIELQKDRLIIDVTTDGLVSRKKVTLEEPVEWLQTTILNQLPELSNGDFDHSQAITVVDTNREEFKSGDTVYAVSRINIANKDTFEAFRVYRIVYK